jgi:formylglycine-generating enzyme required for sulfatase activity
MKKILFLAANPSNTDRLRVDKEAREIKEGLQRSRYRDQFQLVTEWAVRSQDFYRAMLDVKPQIVHFSGHGGGEHGIVLEGDDTDNMEFIATEQLAKMFKEFASKGLKCVVLNACYSTVQAEAISQHVDYVIGMNQTIPDQVAINFAVAFYDAIWTGESFQAAFDLARTRISGLDEQNIPVLRCKPQVSERSSSQDLASNRNFPFGRRRFLRMVGWASVGAATSLVGWQIHRSLKVTSSDQFTTVSVDSSGKVIEHKKGQAKVFTELLEKTVALEMVWIPEGTYRMGSPDDEVGRRSYESLPGWVKVPAFWMGKYEVTQAQWIAVANLPKISRELWTGGLLDETANHPVAGVSWDQAVEFCDRLSHKTGQTYRLPTGKEWEYACRAGTTTPFHFGETITTDLANYKGAGNELLSDTYAKESKGIYRGKTTEVGSFKFANAFGLYDMHGNVSEWCQDPLYEFDRIMGHMVCGCDWASAPEWCRSASFSYDDEYLNEPSSIGFRVVCESV